MKWALVAALLVAGCIQPGTTEDPTLHEAARQLDNTDPLAVIPVAGTVGAAVAYHEEWTGTAGADRIPAPLDFNLTYHGVQPVYDAFAREVPAYVYARPVWRWVVDRYADSPAGSDEGHYELDESRAAFLQADAGRVSDSIDGMGLTSFTRPDWVVPGGGVYLFMAIHAMGGDVTRELRVGETKGHTLYASFVRDDDGFRPFPGDCETWTPTIRYEPPLPSSKAAEPVLPVNVRHPHNLFCLEPGSRSPLWVWVGTEEDGAYTLQRRGPAFQPPPLQGTRLPGVIHTPVEWSPVEAPAATRAVAGPTYVPPIGNAGDWAGRLATHAQALYLDPDYVTYRGRSETPYLRYALMDADVSTALLPGLPGLDAVPEAFTNETWMDVSDGANGFVGQVYSHYGTPSEGNQDPDQHVAGDSGRHSFLFESRPFTDAPKLPATDALMDQLRPLRDPNGPRERVVFELVESDHIKAGSWGGFWGAYQRCSPNGSGRALHVNALTGAAMLLQVVPSGSPHCWWVGGKEPPQGAIAAGHDLRPLVEALTSSMPGWPLPEHPCGRLAGPCGSGTP